LGSFKETANKSIKPKYKTFCPWERPSHLARKIISTLRENVKSFDKKE
jgi:hypothetical protein